MTHDEIQKIAQTVCASSMSPYRNWQDAYVVISTGLELGLKPMRALQTIHNMKGKPSPSAALLVGLVKGADVCQSWRTVENTDRQCTIETLRRGEAEKEALTYTIADAKRAGLGGGNWNKYPREMLYARCSAILARRVYPDVVAGLYVPEELDNGTDAPPAAEPAPAPAPKIDKRRKMVESERLPAYIRRVAETCDDDDVPQLFAQAMVIAGKASAADKVREACKGPLAKYGRDALADAYLSFLGGLLASATPDRDAAVDGWNAMSNEARWKASQDIAATPDDVTVVASRLLGDVA